MKQPDMVWVDRAVLIDAAETVNAWGPLTDEVSDLCEKLLEAINQPIRTLWNHPPDYQQMAADKAGESYERQRLQEELDALKDEMMTVKWSTKCLTFEPECACCQAWRLFEATDRLPTQDEVLAATRESKQ